MERSVTCYHGVGAANATLPLELHRCSLGFCRKPLLEADALLHWGVGGARGKRKVSIQTNSSTFPSLNQAGAAIQLLEQPEIQSA